MKIKSEILRTVAFLGFKNMETGEDDLRASAFLVTPERETTNGNYAKAYITTALHNIIYLKDKGVSEVVIVINLKEPVIKDGKPIWRKRFDINISKWFFDSSDSTIDVAIAPFSAEIKEVDFLIIGKNSLAEKKWLKEWNVSVGDEVNVTGFFQHHYGKMKNEPIVRIGNIAAFPSERINTKLGAMEAFLIECRSIGGLSGSPVFVNKGHIFWADGGIKQYRDEQPVSALIGLIHGHYDIQNENVGEERAMSINYINSGIAVVTPIQKVIDLIDLYESQE